MMVDVESLYHLLPQLSRLSGVALEGKLGAAAAFARVLAAAMLYPGEEGEPYCPGRDSALILRGIHPDVMEVGGGQTSSISVDAVRAVLREAHLKPNQAPGRVFILHDASAMTPQAQNALLKTLEAPPGGARFIFTVENRHNLLPTVQSRLATAAIEVKPSPLPDRLTGAARETAMLVEDWEHIIEVLGEKSAIKLLEDCEEAFEAICDANAYRIMAVLAAREKKRDEFILFCSSLRSVCGKRLISDIGGDVKRLSRAAEVLDEAREMAGQNVFLPLLGCYTAQALTRVV